MSGDLLRPSEVWPRVAGPLLLALVVAATTVTVLLQGRIDVVAVTLPYTAVGAALVWKRPREAIGWMLLACGVLWATTFLTAEVAEYLDGWALVATAWLAEWTWFPGLVAVFVALPILFPSGHPDSKVWRWVLRFAAALCLAFVVLTTCQGRFSPSDSLTVDNPLAIIPLDDVEVLLLPAALPLFLLGPVAAISRFRRSTGSERQQLRWFMFAAVACALAFALNAFAEDYALVEALVVLGLSLPPVGIWIAVTRHRLYDIDHVVSRTVSYGALTTILVGVYAGSVFLLGVILPVEGDLAIAAATLVVAALFNPLRRHTQTIVDRRFNRSRYDALRTIDSFARRLRSQVEVDELRSECRRRRRQQWSRSPCRCG